MDPLQTPAYLKKTLALLKTQMRKAGLYGTYIVSVDAITYQEADDTK
ncbi:31594_t:CDS:2 [Gigaspora margarita]|uniref:31594_t:CDS:1 n=1 Tax=Gigaspora margarita TaxID=4874 RepID=A0ABN7UR67_GIGMA|nr:31594_t:CDS:2 [Gigaspora margarita]